MAMPQQARDQIERSKQLHAEIYGTSIEAAPDFVPAAAGDGSASGAPPAIADQQPTPAPLLPPLEHEQPHEQPSDDYQQQYNVLKGKYNKEVPTLHRQLREQQAQIESMQNLLGTMQAQAAPPVLTRENSFVSPKDVEEFGEETVDFVRRASRGEVSAEVQQLRNELAQVKGQVAQVGQYVQQNAQQTVFDALANWNPQWEQLNQDPRFLEWLQDPEPYSGHQRQALLTQAFERNDAARVIAFFDGFLREYAVTHGQPSAQLAPAGQRQPQVQLETLVAPGRARSVPARAQEGGHIWRRSDITMFYRDVQMKRFVGREQERQRIEADIFAAEREGRIVP